MSTTSFAYERRPLLIVFKEASLIKETYAGRNDTVALEAHHLVPRDHPSHTVVVFMHPAGGTQYLPMVARPTAAVLSTNNAPAVRRCPPLSGTATAKASGTPSQVRLRNTSCRHTAHSLV